MEASLHGEYIHTTQFAEDQFTTMAFYRRDREIGNLRVWYLLFVSYF